MRSDIAQGDGMYKSTDGGKTWTHIGLADSQQIGRILVDPHNPDVVLVAALGHPYGPNAERGVFRSRDGGATWQTRARTRTPTPARSTSPSSRAIPTWSMPPCGRPGGRRGTSIRRRAARAAASTSRPTAATPGRRHRPRPAGHAGPHRPRRRAGRAASGSTRWSTREDEGGLYRSDDAGATWTRVSGDKRIWQRGWYFGGITVDPANADVVYVCNTIVLRSDDGGKHFVPVKGDATAATTTTRCGSIRRTRSGASSASTRARWSRSNGGATWSSLVQPADRPVLPRGHRQPLSLLGLRRAAGFRRRRRARAAPTAIDGINIDQFHEITAGGESDNIAPDPDDPDIVFGGRVDKLDLRTGQTRIGRSDPGLSRTCTARPGPCRWCSRQARSRRSTSRNQRLFRTTDGGEHWTAISPDLTRENPGIAGQPRSRRPRRTIRGPGPRRGVVYAIASVAARPTRLSGQAPTTAWSGARATRAAHWTDVTPERRSRRGPRSASSSPRTSTPRPPISPSTATASTTSSPTSTAPTTAARTGADRRRHCRDGRLRQRRARGPGAQGLLYAGTERGRLRLLRRRRALAAAAGEPARAPRCATSTCTATTW